MIRPPPRSPLFPYTPLSRSPSDSRPSPERATRCSAWPRRSCAGPRTSRTPRLGSGAWRVSPTRRPIGCELLATWGRFVHRRRWIVLVLCVLSSGISLWLMRGGGRFDSTLVPSETQSGQALHLMQRDLPARPLAFHLIFRHPTLPASHPTVQADISRSLAPLRDHPRVAAVRTAWDTAPMDPERVS